MCSDTQIRDILACVAAGAKEIFSEKLVSVILFGSYARGDFDEESDIDILIIADLPSSALAEYRKQIDHLCGTLLLEYGVVISAIEKDAETYNRYKDSLPFYRNIETEGLKIA